MSVCTHSSFGFNEKRDEDALTPLWICETHQWTLIQTFLIHNPITSLPFASRFLSSFIFFQKESIYLHNIYRTFYIKYNICYTISINANYILKFNLTFIYIYTLESFNIYNLRDGYIKNLYSLKLRWIYNILMIINLIL